jgi:hypothetical protein
MMKFYRQHSAEPTHPEKQFSAVTTQFGLMMEPPHMCDHEYRSET